MKKALKLIKKSVEPQSNNNKSLKSIKEELNLGYERIFKPLEEKIVNSKKIIFITDQFFEDLPLGLLYDKINSKYLVEKYSISYYPQSAL